MLTPSQDLLYHPPTPTPRVTDTEVTYIIVLSIGSQTTCSTVFPLDTEPEGYFGLKIL